MDLLEHVCGSECEAEHSGATFDPAGKETPPATHGIKPLDAATPPATDQPPTEEEKTFESLLLDTKAELSDTETSRLERKDSELSAGVGEIRTEEQIKREELLVRRVFTARTEIAGNSRIHKCLFKQENAESLVQVIASLHETINVIGIYGSTHQSLELIQQLMQYEKELVLPPEEETEGIIAYFRPEVSVLCFFYKVGTEEVYERKPYPSTSHEAIYVKLLLDLCPLVVCCISESMQQDWYSSAEFQSANPFQPKVNKSLVLHVDKKKVGSLRVEELAVVNNCRDRERVYFTADCSNLMFTLTTFKEMQYLPAHNALKELKAWLKDRKNHCIENFGIKTYSCYPYNPDFAISLYNSFYIALRSLSQDYARIITTIKLKYNQMKNDLSLASLAAYEEFIKLLLEKYQFAQVTERDEYEHYGWLERDFSYEDVIKRLKDLLVTQEDYRKGFSLAPHFERLLTSHTENPNESIIAARQSLSIFFKTQCDMLQAKREALIEEKYSALEAEFSELIRQSAYSQATEVYTLETYSFVMNENQLVVQQTGIENKVCLPLLTTCVQFHVLTQSNALLTFESEDCYSTAKFDPSSSRPGNVNELFSLQSDILIASGSTVSLLVWFSNGLQRALYGAADLFKFGSGISLKVYGQSVSQVLSACVLQQGRKILLMNEAGALFSIELVSSEQQLEQVMGLRPRHGLNFYDVKCSGDETLFFLLADSEIEVYHSNFEFAKAVPIVSPFISYKVLSLANSHVVVALTGNSITAYRLWSESEGAQSSVEKPEQGLVAGNPVIDILYYSLIKYGSSAYFFNRKPTLYLFAGKREKKCEKYFRSISFLGQHIIFEKSVSPSTLKKLQEELISGSFKVKIDKLKWQLSFRSPLQLCAFQEGNLIPLQNGRRSFVQFAQEVSSSKADFVTACVSFFRLGALESIICAAKTIRVISIIGKPDSGKSHLLNRLFGTYFDAAASGCTDGIWASISKIEGQTFCILDCEGFPSVSRSEEMKLGLLLAAVSDVVIINQDRASIGSLSALFEGFNLSIGRVKGSNLFKGRLEIAIRNVAAREDAQVISEVNEFVQRSIAGGKADFLLKLFGEDVICSPYPSCEDEASFAAAVASRRQFYSENVTSRWTGELFLLAFKATFAHIYADDATSIDNHVLRLHLPSTVSRLKKVIEEPAAIKETVAPENPSIAFTLFIAGRSFPIETALFDIEVSLSTSFTVFEALMEQYAPAELKASHHNEWCEALDGLIRYYFAKYKTVVLSYLEKTIEVTCETKPTFEEGKESIEKFIDSTLVQVHTLCLRKCRGCGLCCKRVQNHSGDCLEDFHSLGCCLLSEESTESDLRSNPLSDPCDTKDCKQTSTSALTHERAHRSASPCGRPCALFTACKRTCEIDRSLPHDLHDCGQKNCPLPCSLRDSSSACTSEDHLHSLREKPASSSDQGSLHFCEKVHSCQSECAKDGICELISVSEMRESEIESDLFPYLSVVHRPVKRPCRRKVPAGSSSHTGAHCCEKAVHTCPEACPDCGAYCGLDFGHRGLHSAAHRKAARLPGASRADNCDQSCLRKGRGHVHVVQCGAVCLGVAQAGLAVHSDGRFLPDLEGKCDLVECGTYWKLKGWEPPVQKKSPCAQQLFSYCPFFCAPSEGTDRIYCEGPLFHTSSTAHKDHHFTACAHQSLAEFDVAFVFNCAGSSSSNFLQVRDAVAEAIKRYEGKELTMKFAVVSYAHHCQQSTCPASPQVAIYPPSRQLMDFDPVAASSFLTSANSSGRGLNRDKGLLEDLSEADRLTWRPKANRLCVIVAEDCRDCGIFHSRTDHAAMDSCGSRWESLFASMKSCQTELRFFNVNSPMDSAAEFLQMKYGEGFECASIKSARDLRTAVESSIVKFIDRRLKFVVRYDISV